MGKFNKPSPQSNKSRNKSRKQLRKEKRLSKKERKNEHYKKRFLISNINVSKQSDDDKKVRNNSEKSTKSKKKVQFESPDRNSPMKTDSQELQKLNHTNEINLKRKLEIEMKKQRKMQLLEDNKYEDMEIKKLEKHLKMNKRKTKSLPKSFAEEGLDYLLNVCDSNKVKNMLDNQDSGSEFDDDLAIVSGKKKIKKTKKVKQPAADDSAFSSDSDSVANIADPSMEVSVDDESDDDSQLCSQGKTSNEISSDESMSADDQFSAGSDVSDDEADFDEDDDEEEEEEAGIDDDDDDDDEDLSAQEEEHLSSHSQDDVDHETVNKEAKEGKYWEDIYGRKRDEEGNVVQSEGKYIPPHLKAKLMSENSERKERLARLSRQLKGLLNRLAENNMHKIVSEIDQLYMQNSRNDMNETLTKLMFDSLIQPVIIPERLVSEHTMLIAALHANVGTEVGAYFLQGIIEKFDDTLKKGINEESKELENILLVISYLYIFKVCHALLIFDILNRVCSKESLGEKEVELLLIVLRSAGFSLRKDDPLSLKNLIVKVQSQVSGKAHQSRVKFMLDVLIAIKNNNATKVPQYEANRHEQLKKILKSVVHKGKYISELKISLEDLLNAEERGRWWIVGSAWAGDSKTLNAKENGSSNSSSFSSKLLELAKKQRMNTDARRNIFCILMSAEDFQDAFEKILKLGLKGQQEQDIVHVIMHCSLQEKTYNPFYTYVAAQFCTSNRKFVMMFQYHLWDRLKELKDLKGFQITNMAKFLSRLFLQNSLPLSALKVIEFASLEKPIVRLLRQLFLSMLLDDNKEDVATVFARISQSSKLHIFRESIRLFFHHFLLKNINDESPETNLLKKRIKSSENILMGVNVGDNFKLH